ncbi:hypothetical protein CASFOL_042485 [Castilleja foliolosa]|uniref:NAF domain-containing protein n=1 Tax=Castilleja foliolosa TaxID=1961234 RepID=A0ABD3BBD1_9LAMI
MGTQCVGSEARYLNAFDLISYSCGADLSGLFSASGGDWVNSEIFVSAEWPEKIFERIEAAAEGIRVTKKGMGVRLQVMNWEYAVKAEINQLTEEVAMVEVKGDASGHDLWKDKFEPRLFTFH